MVNDPGFFNYLVKFVAKNYDRILLLTWQHIYISLIALFITLIICVPLGIYLTKNERLTPYAIGLANIFETIPSLALLAFLIFPLGIGNKNAICALVLYAALPVLQNTYTGIKNVPPSFVQAARGMGMTEMQILLKVQLPLARPVLIAGIRVATVWIIGTATLAAAIGGGGLGKLIFSGLASMRNEVVFAGAFPATILALLTDQGLKILQEYYSPKRRAQRLARKMDSLENIKREEREECQETAGI
ncbi:MAG: ABC transporter permease [Bacillota bacterium]